MYISENQFKIAPRIHLCVCVCGGGGGLLNTEVEQHN